MNTQQVTTDGDRERHSDDAVKGTQGGAAETAEQVEARARRMGWVPEDEWKPGRGRKPAEFLSAQDFIEQTEAEAPKLRSRLRDYDRRAVANEQTINALTQQVGEQGTLLKEFLARNRAAEQAGYDRARRELVAEQREAAKAADTDRHEEATRKIEDLDKEKRAADEAAAKAAAEAEKKPAQQQQLQPEVRDFIAENSWFERDPVLRTAAIEALNVISAANPGWPLKDQLDAVAEQIEEEFPQRLGKNPKRKAPGAVGSPSGGDGGRETSKKKGKSVSDLPDDAKEDLARMKKLIPGFTDDEFLKEYKW